MYPAAIRSRAFLIPALALLWAAPAAAQSDPRFAADRFEPSERGSEWFANESLNFRGPMPFRIGVVSSYGERLFVLRNGNGDAVASPLRNDEVLHIGASASVFGFLRVAVDTPLHLITSGRTATAGNTVYRSPDNEQGYGDIRFGADVRVYGHDRGPIRLAMGAQFWAPTGEQSQWASDGEWRIRPRAILAGDSGMWTWSAQVGVNFRDPDIIGTDLGLNGAFGVRLMDSVVVGPEFFTSTNVTKGAFEKSTTPFELMLGGHWLIGRMIRVGVGIGRGFTQAATDPNYRLLGMLEYAPEYEPKEPPPPPLPPPVPPPPKPVVDTDHDKIPDDQDACPAVAGIPQPDASQNGCPPDTDGDGVNDLGDACPTQPGPATDDSATTGCPTTPAK